jgi:PRC-barrel domain protein
MEKGDIPMKSKFGLFAITAIMLAGAASDGMAASVLSPQPANPTVERLANIPMVGVPLNEVKNPKVTLDNIMIHDQTGASVGTVSDVLVDGTGTAVELQVDVGNYLGMGTKMIAIRASNFKYDQEHKRLVTGLTKNQIHAIAGG